MSRHTYELTAREKQALIFYLDGLPYQDIAEKMHITRSAANAHINNAKQKLGAKSFVEVRDKAIELGLMENTPCDAG